MPYCAWVLATSRREIIATQMRAASQRGSMCWRKTSARYGEAGPLRALCVEAGTKDILFRVQTLIPRLVPGIRDATLAGGAAAAPHVDVIRPLGSGPP